MYEPLTAHATLDSAAAADFVIVRLHTTFELLPDGRQITTEDREIRLQTQRAVEQFSQEKFEYVEGRETLEVLEAYVIDVDGARHNVPHDRIYTQLTEAGASSATHADGKVRVVVYPSLAQGARIVIRTRKTQREPALPGYFGFATMYGPHHPMEDVRITVIIPDSTSM
ncbi:DUF3857 domain-containing protein [Stenotrophomonas maltophilia]|uniref:DUF3857 domain-containing protein n=1 Tax=Stenotrophomonas maltophilia TaxID=40324 RepID=UPI00143268F8|nr:DUF3857 domain-containing protein [Stenotrophomonas maltophilia]